MPKSLFIPVIFLLLFYSCSKDVHKPAQQADVIKISVLSGDNQSSAAGVALTDSIVIKVTKGGNPLNSSIIQIIGSGCNSDLIVNVNTNSSGIAKYLWRLAANQGTQTLNVVAIDRTIRADSATVHATSTSLSNDTISACTPYNMPPVNIVRLTTGRLLACFQGNTSLRYSDDNAISWSPVKSFGSSHNIIATVTSPQDEIFTGTLNDGIFYSKDAGTTWTEITPPTFNKVEGITDMEYSGNGTLIVTGHTNNIFVSADKGKTWIESSNGLTPNFGYLFPCRLNNGDLYVTNLNNDLFKSVDGGANWIVQDVVGTHKTQAIYVDNNGWLYKSKWTAGGAHGGSSTFSISKDNGQTFTDLYLIFDFVASMAILQDGNFYYSNFGTLNEVYDNNNIIPVAESITSYITNRSWLISQYKLIYIDRGLIKKIVH